MKKITILLASIFSMAFIIPSIAEEKKESIEQEKKIRMMLLKKKWGMK
ncbi:MAG: hypothetical protein WCG46_06715 [Methylophilaceae bacterium]